MQVAVIIPARNAARVLTRTLEAVRSQAAEVVVVDNGSTDATAAVALAAGARVVHEPRPSRAGARNAGARATAAPRLAFLDAECVPEPGWLQALDACLDVHPLVGGRVVIEQRRASRLARFDAAWRFRHEESIAAEGWAASANLAMRREVLERVGGFDPSFTHSAEDVDLCLRAGGAAYCPGAVVRHPAADDVRALVRRALRQGYASTQLHHRHAGRIGRRDWRHPRPVLRGDWALERFGLEDAELRCVARLDYAGRVAGSAWAELRRAR